MNSGGGPFRLPNNVMTMTMVEKFTLANALFFDTEGGLGAVSSSIMVGKSKMIIKESKRYFSGKYTVRFTKIERTRRCGRRTLSEFSMRLLTARRGRDPPTPSRTRSGSRLKSQTDACEWPEKIPSTAGAQSRMESKFLKTSNPSLVTSLAIATATPKARMSSWISGLEMVVDDGSSEM
jgi:hypothetical protein